MANIKSAIKRTKTTEKRTLRNKMVKTSVKTVIKKFEEAALHGNVDGAKELYPRVTKSIDMAVSKGIIHKNTASRKKSRLALMLNKAIAK